MRVLELGNYIIPAYAGMVLAEQGHDVEKWVLSSTDPIHGLKDGEKLWQWINAGKRLVERHVSDVTTHLPPDVDIVIDNLRPSTLRRFGIDPARLASSHGLRWVSMRSEQGEVSFDIIAQARAWRRFSPWVPFYIGDTAAGLWLAFKALAAPTPGHFVLGHASCLAKLVEGELVCDVERDARSVPWDRDAYGLDEQGRACVQYRGQTYIEPPRSRAWQWDNLWHRAGRMVI